MDLFFTARGRKKADPMKRISQYKRNVDALRKKVKRLEKKAEVLSQTIKILEEEKRTIPNSAVLVESGLDELIRNEHRHIGKTV